MIGMLLFVISAQAADDPTYQAGLARIKRQQAQADVFKKNLERKLGLAEVIPELRQTAADEAKAPLFQTYGSLSTVRIPAGKLLYATTLNRLEVGPEGSPTILVLDQDQGALSGLRLMGTAKQGATEGRLHLNLNRLLLNTGRTVELQGSALDSAGAYGLKAEVISSKALAVMGAIATGLVAGAAASQQTQNANSFGFVTPQLSGRNAILQGVAQSAADESKRLIEEATTEKPVLVVGSKTEVVVLIQEEVKF